MVLEGATALFLVELSLVAADICFISFTKEKFKKSQGKVDFFPKLPNESSQAKVAASPQPPPQTAKNTLELKCFQCDQIIMFKPEYFQIKVTSVCGEQSQTDCYPPNLL